jgi:hypothetical protein
MNSYAGFQTIISLILFMALKTIADVIMHIIEHGVEDV